MVNSPWKKQCANCPQGEKQIKPHHFERCQWQRSLKTNLWYLFYRWSLATAFLIICIYSISSPTQRKIQTYNNGWKWFAFLTNWAYLICTIQSFIALWIVQSTWMNRKNPKDANRKLPGLYQAYWVLHNLAIDMALVVSLIYWSLVHDSAVHKLDAVNFLVHACNSIMMIVDMSLLMHPCRLLYIFNVLGVGVAYVLFTFIYFVCGGTDRDGNPYIYKALDWRQPGKAVGFALLCLGILSIIHCLTYGFYRLRAHIGSRVNPSLSNPSTPQEKPMLTEMA